VAVDYGTLHGMAYRTTALALAVILLAAQPGCKVNKVRKVDVATVPQPEQETLSGVTTKRGEEVSFDAPGGALKQDVIHAQVKKAPYSIPLSEVQRLWITRQGISAIRTIGFSAAIAVGTLVVLAAIVLAAKQSCPFIYSWDGTRYIFDAEPYGGAIARGLERDDYSPLDHLRAQDGLYRLLLTNEVDETQYTNLLELWVADHPPGTRVLPDDDGRLYALTQIEPLAAARDRHGNDLLPWLQATDRRIWEPAAAPGSDGELRQDVILTFPKPAAATRAKLIVNAGTGLWGSLMIKRMIELRGREAAAWLASMDTDPAQTEALHSWTAREELYRLGVHVEEPTGWELRGSFLGAGPLLVKDRVVPLDLTHVRGRELHLRLRPPVGFWALNSFAISYAPDQPVDFQRVSPTLARTTQGQDVLPDLLAKDDRYYAMPNMTDRAELTFPAPPAKPGMDRTVILHSRGWYQLHLTAGGDADVKTLQQIALVRDAAARYAVDEYGRWLKSFRTSRQPTPQ
jgi:hypothetical protein